MLAYFTVMLRLSQMFVSEFRSGFASTPNDGEHGATGFHSWTSEQEKTCTSCCQSQWGEKNHIDLGDVYFGTVIPGEKNRKGSLPEPGKFVVLKIQRPHFLQFPGVNSANVIKIIMGIWQFPVLT